MRKKLLRTLFFLGVAVLPSINADFSYAGIDDDGSLIDVLTSHVRRASGHSSASKSELLGAIRKETWDSRGPIGSVCTACFKAMDSARTQASGGGIFGGVKKGLWEEWKILALQSVNDA